MSLSCSICGCVPADQQQGHVAYPSNGGGVDCQQDLEESLGSERGGLILIRAQAAADRLESDPDPGVFGGILVVEVAGGDGGDGDQLVDRGEAAADGGIGGAAVLEGAEVGGDDFGCPPLGAAVGHPGSEVGQVRAQAPRRPWRPSVEGEAKSVLGPGGELPTEGAWGGRWATVRDGAKKPSQPVLAACGPRPRGDAQEVRKKPASPWRQEVQFLTTRVTCPSIDRVSILAFKGMLVKSVLR